MLTLPASGRAPRTCEGPRLTPRALTRHSLPAPSGVHGGDTRHGEQRGPTNHRVCTGARQRSRRRGKSRIRGDDDGGQREVHIVLDLTLRQGHFEGRRSYCLVPGRYLNGDGVGAGKQPVKAV